MPQILPSTGMLDLVAREQRHQGNTHVSVVSMDSMQLIGDNSWANGDIQMSMDTN